MANYELVVIYDPFLQEQEYAAELEKAQEQVKRRGGNVQNVDVWGRRRLAYPIAKKMEGHYVIITFDGESKASELAELERGFRLNEKVLREMLTRVPVIKPRKEKVKKPKAERAQQSDVQYGAGRSGSAQPEVHSAGTAGAGQGSRF